LVKISGSWFPATFVAAACTVPAFYLPGTAAWAQSPSGSVQKTTITSRAVNKSYTYPDIDLWDTSKWPAPKAKPIATWIETHEKAGPSTDYTVPQKYQGLQRYYGNPDYTWKTNSIRDADVIDEFARMGLDAEIRERAGLIVVVTPKKVQADKDHKAPVLVVPYYIDKRDVFWGMNTLKHFKKYNELLAQRGDFIIVYYVMERSGVGVGQSVGAGDGVGDPKRIYLDVSSFVDQGVKIASVPGLNWTDDNGKNVDPDAAIEHIGFIPVLNIAGKTTAGPNWTLGPMDRGQFPGINVPFDAQLVIHSPFGQHWMEGIAFAYRHPKDDDPALKTRFEQMGLVGGANDYKGRRYYKYSPRVAVERHEKLPLVLVNTEVGYPNQYGLADAYGRYLDWFKLAARGDVNLLIYNLQGAPATPGGETPMDMAYDLIKELEKTDPIDPSRIYVTGHSHAGHETREFAYRHPDMVAAAAPLGNSAGLAAPSYSHEAIMVDDQRIEAWNKIDMPLITLGAVGELLSPHTTPSLIQPDYDLFIDAWQRRLKASRTAMKTREQIMAAEHSGDYVTRLYGIPNDGSSLQVIDGVEHYIIDIRNIDGRDHMRFVAIDNIFHTPTPTMPALAWTFMSRFARDQKTGKVIELY
jgi:hypothetical protein